MAEVDDDSLPLEALQSTSTSFDEPTALAVDWHTIRPILISLACALVLLAGVTHLDDTAQRAQWLESSGQSRGPILDRFGRPLAYSLPTPRGARRAYALSGLAPILGYRSPNRSWQGLERTYSRNLDATAARSDWRTFIGHLSGRVARGDALRLTISRHVEATALAALGNASGAVVALDPRTGGVLAMVSKPYCSAASLNDPVKYRRCAGAATAPLINRAIARTYSPGSDFKIVTLTAALDSKRFRLSDVFSGADIFGPSPYFDNSVYASNITRDDLRSLTLSQALAFSDNFTFAHIGLTLGTSTVLTYAHRFRVGRSIPFDLPVAVSTIANANPHPSRAVLAQSAFGAGVDRVTPLQMALVAATVANGGVMMAPHLFLALQSPNGAVLRRYLPTPLGRVMRAATAADVTTAMSFVVNHGSGFKAQIKGIQVAGKTGTAPSGGNRPNAWFICFAPARHPVVAVAVLHQFSGEGFEYAAPVARKVLLAALAENGLRPK